MDDRLVELEERFAHQELAIDTLTRTVLAQERALAELRNQVETLQAQLRAMAVSNVAAESEETPPPHY